jgi:multisubunit Na+/H+ antiporter MnhG subunit
MIIDLLVIVPMLTVIGGVALLVAPLGLLLLNDLFKP